LKRQRGHCHVPCRHSISAAHRQHRSITAADAIRAGGRRLPSPCLGGV